MIQISRHFFSTNQNGDYTITIWGQPWLSYKTSIVVQLILKLKSPPGHLHTGNVFVHDNGSVKLSEFENYLLGIKSKARHRAVDLKGPSSSLEALDVFSFGHLIYELATGRRSRLNALETIDDLPNNLPDPISDWRFLISRLPFLNFWLCRKLTGGFAVDWRVQERLPNHQ